MNDWHYARPTLAESYLNLFKIGLTSARALFARRRMGKTEFLKKDLIPIAEAQGYMAVYTNLWDLEMDPATAIITELYKTIEPKGFNKIWETLKRPISKVRASGKIPGIGEGAVEAELMNDTRVSGTLLMEAMTAFDKRKKQLLLVIDEAQVLAYEENAHFAHALRAALDIRKERIKVIFAGSSEMTLRRMFGVASEPFYNWAPLEPFALLGKEFIAAMVARVNQICKYPLSVADATEAFTILKNTPEFFRRYIEQYLNNPEHGSLSAVEMTITKVFSDKDFKRQWDVLLAADQAMLTMLANGVEELHGKLAMQHLGRKLGLENSIGTSTVQNAVRRLMNQCIITKIEHGVYQFEDTAFADWIKHNYAEQGLFIW